MNRYITLGCFCLVLSCAERASPPAEEPTGLTPASSPNPRGAAQSNEARPMAVKPERERAIYHLKNHVQYPATRAEILAACADTSEFTAGEKQWFADQLPDRTYNSADEVVNAIGGL